MTNSNNQKNYTKDNNFISKNMTIEYAYNEKKKFDAIFYNVRKKKILHVSKGSM